MLKKLDNIHIDLNPLDAKNKDFNAVLSTREDGKSTRIIKNWWNKKIKYGSYAMFLMRNAVDISTESIEKIALTVREYCDESFHAHYKESEFDKGIVHVMDDDGNLVFYVVALSIKLKRLKDLKIPNCAMIIMDEFIIDPTTGESYLKAEAFKIKELFKTIYRDNKGDNGKPRLRFYAFGNPCSLYHPLFIDWGVDTNALKIKGEPDESLFQVGDVWCVWRKTLSKELYQKVVETDPTYRLGADSTYKDYALRGLNVNDNGFRILQDMPLGYRLKHLIRINSKTIGIWENTNWSDRESRLYCCYVSAVSKYRDIFVFEFNDMVGKSVLFSATERMQFAHLREAVRKNRVQYANIEIAYMIQEIYTYL